MRLKGESFGGNLEGQMEEHTVCSLKQVIATGNTVHVRNIYPKTLQPPWDGGPRKTIKVQGSGEAVSAERTGEVV